MKQEQVFKDMEGDGWFSRNSAGILNRDMRDDPVIKALGLVNLPSSLTSVLELGCANGFRLDALRSLNVGTVHVGADISEAAIRDGSERYPELDLYCSPLQNFHYDDPFDLVIVNFVLHWVDRDKLLDAVATIDRQIADGGLLVVGDFLPDAPYKREYHHHEANEIFTYKQDYARVFESAGLYKEVLRVTGGHGETNMLNADTNDRTVISVLKKQLTEYYPLS
jgi:SAM-dependent methyltransferase